MESLQEFFYATLEMSVEAKSKNKFFAIVPLKSVLFRRQIKL